MLLVGISVDDTKEDADKLAKKVLGIRLFPNSNSDFWKLNIKEAQGQILSVSQFTLYARTKKNKPDFHLSQKGDIARELYDYFLANLRSGLGDENVMDGQFGAMMSCNLTNEGPVTIILDSKE